MPLLPTPTQQFEACEALQRFSNSGRRRKDGLCIVCQNPMPARNRQYCSKACSDWFNDNHTWTIARSEAYIRNRGLNPCPEGTQIWVPDRKNYRGDVIEPAHFITAGRWVALCSMCFKPEHPYDHPDYRKRELKVDHIIPLDGGIRGTTCRNHQENLRVICHECHLKVTAEQRAAGLITTAKQKKEWRDAQVRIG